jgi:hypothetical protein
MQEAMELSRERLGNEGNPKMMNLILKILLLDIILRHNTLTQVQNLLLCSPLSVTTHKYYILLQDMKKNDLFAIQNGKNIGTDRSADRHRCVRPAVVPARQSSKKIL